MVVAREPSRARTRSLPAHLPLCLGTLLMHAVLELPAPVELLDEAPRIAPSRMDFDIEFEEDLHLQHALDLHPGCGADLLEHLSAFPDQNSLLPPALAVDRGR